MIKFFKVEIVVEADNPGEAERVFQKIIDRNSSVMEFFGYDEETYKEMVDFWMSLNVNVKQEIKKIEEDLKAMENYLLTSSDSKVDVKPIPIETCISCKFKQAFEKQEKCDHMWLILEIHSKAIVSKCLDCNKYHVNELWRK